MDDHLKPFACPEPGCNQRFTSEDRLNAHCDSNHYVHHLLAALPNVDQTPTPTKFLRSCEEVGLFQEINPFDKDFKKAVDQQQNEVMLSSNSTIPYSVLEESVEGDEITVNVSLPTTCIESHENSAAVVVNAGDNNDGMDVNSTVVAAVIQPSDVLITSSTSSLPVTLAQTSPTTLAADLNTSQLPSLTTADSSVEDFSSLGAVVGNLSVQVMLKLPTGETVPCSMPAFAIVPELSSTTVGTGVLQNTTSLSSMPDGRLSTTSHLSSQPVFPPLFQVQLGVLTAVSSGAVMGINSQPGAMFDVPESGLTALGIAASTREKLKAAVQRSPNSRTRPTLRSSPDGEVPVKQPCLSSAQEAANVAVSTSQQLHVQRQAADTSTHIQPSSRSNVSDEEADTRRRQFLESNRVAALRCRQKKKSFIASLENKVAELQKVNDGLESEIRYLKQEIYELKLILLEHKDCPAMTTDINVINEMYMMQKT